MTSNYDWPKKNARLFEPSNDFYNNAWFNWVREGKWDLYADSYKEAADILVDRLLGSRNHSLDKFVYPICFMYRQYLELRLKEIILKCLPQDQRKIKVRKLNHNICFLWCEAKKVLEEIYKKDDKSVLVPVEDYVMQFHQMDESSFSFRYPVDRNDDTLFKDIDKIDVRNLRIRINQLANFLDSCSAGIDAYLEYE
ncbi:MAG: hypothetical protein HZA00_15080 [Nitrospinae bacterium]|nr:hypothetical protein [Nitrospinota bacterium]